MSAADIVDAVYADAATAVGSAATYAQLIGAISYEPTYVTAVFNSPAMSVPANYNVNFTLGDVPDVAQQSVSMRATPTLTGLGSFTFSDIVVPDFTDVAPQLSFPDQPVLSEHSAPDTRPVMDGIDIPPDPMLTLPTLPTLAAVVVPDDVNAVIPTFTYTFDMQRPSPPTSVFAFNEQAYNSTLLTAALELLEEDIANGGYGLRPEDELNLWNRAKARVAGAVDGELDNAQREIASRGFSLPQGALNAAIARASQAKTAQLAEVSVDIANKRADMMVQARQFALTTGLNAQQFLMNFHAGSQERLLNANKYLADYGLQIYQAYIQDFQAELERYRVEAGVFETKLRAAVANLDVFRGRLEAARLKGQINQDQIELYNAQFRGVEALVNIYNTQLQGARVKAELQDLKFRVYGEDIKAYLAKLEADGQKVNNYRALVEAQNSKIVAFNSKVSAHNAQLDGARTRASIEKDRLDTEFRNADLRLREFDADMQKWQREYDNSLQNARLIMDKYGVDVNKWAETHRIKLAEQEVRIRNQASNVDNVKVAYNFNLEKYKSMVDTGLRAYQLSTGTTEAVARTYAQLANSSYNAVNAIAAIIE